MGVALTCPACLRGENMSALPAAEMGLGRVGTREFGDGRFGVQGCHMVCGVYFLRQEPMG